MDLSICILTHHQPELLGRCVEACFHEIERAGMLAEVVIIDNASFDGSPQRVAQRFPAAHVLRNEQNLGFSTANNKVIRNTQGLFVLMLNDDAILGEGSLALLWRRMESDPMIAIAGPKLLNIDGSLQRNFTNRRFPRLRALLFGSLGLTPLLEKWAVTRDLLTSSYDPEVSGETDHIAGACLLARREALGEVGLFDEGFYYLFEDADLCYRAKKAGWKVVYVAEASVTHFGSASLKLLRRSKKRSIYVQSLVYFFGKHSGRFRCFILGLGLGLVLFCQMIAGLFSVAEDGSRAEWTWLAKTFLQDAYSLLREVCVAISGQRRSMARSVPPMNNGRKLRAE